MQNRFVILSSSRSGNTFLQSLLNNHPEIKCYGEIFNPAYPEGFHKWVLRRYSRQLVKHFFRDYSIWSYMNWLLKSSNSSIRAVGFKILYPGQFNFYTNNRSYWQENKFKIIRLVRENYLKRYVSGQIAYQENLWASVERKGKLKKIRIEVKGLFGIFNRIKIINNNIDALASEYPNYSLSYEELAKATSAKFKELLTFLEVDNSVEYETKTVKRNPNLLNDCIENYEEVCNALNETEYARFLD